MTNPVEKAVGAAPVKKPRRAHRRTGKPHGGRRIYPLGSIIAENRHLYSTRLASEILERMAQGETVTAICRSRPDMPHPVTVGGWCHDVEGFAPAYARAQVLQAHAWNDGLIELRDDDSLDPQVKRVKFDITKWVISKTAPMHYGDKLTLAGDPDVPLRHVVELEEAIESLSEPELLALERFNDAVIAAREGKIADDGENSRGDSGNSSRRSRK